MSLIMNSLEKNYDRTIILTISDLKCIDQFLKNYYKKVSYDLHLVDGTKLLNNNLDAVLRYRNANNSRIKVIDIFAKNKNSDGKEETLELSFSETHYKDTPCHFKMENYNEQTRLVCEQKLEEMLSNMEAPYEWLFDGTFIIVFGTILSAILLYLIIYLHSGNWALTIIIMLVGIVLGFIIARGMQIFESQRYPKSCFCLGDQKYKEGLKTRTFNNIIRPAIISLMISLVAGVLLSFIS